MMLALLLDQLLLAFDLDLHNQLQNILDQLDQLVGMELLELGLKLGLLPLVLPLLLLCALCASIAAAFPATLGWLCLVWLCPADWER